MIALPEWDFCISCTSLMKQKAYIDSYKAVIKHPNVLLTNRPTAPDHTSFHRRFAYIDRHVVIAFVNSTVSLEYMTKRHLKLDWRIRSSTRLTWSWSDRKTKVFLAFLNATEQSMGNVDIVKKQRSGPKSAQFILRTSPSKDQCLTFCLCTLHQTPLKANKRRLSSWKYS